MKNLSRKAPLAKPIALLTENDPPLLQEATHQENTTPQVEAGARAGMYRRTTVTVERETLSVFTRRKFPEDATQPAATEPPGSNLSESSPDTGGKPLSRSKQ